MFNTNSTFSTAILRSVYVALVTGAIAAITAYQTTDDTKAAILGGLLTALGALGVRGAVEGSVDAARQGNGQVSSSDVQAVGEGKV